MQFHGTQSQSHLPLMYCWVKTAALGDWTSVISRSLQFTSLNGKDEQLGKPYTDL